MAIVGSEKQEKKIGAMGAAAHDMFPAVPGIAFKGAFRFGIESALEKAHYENWERVAAHPPETRRRFFEQVLEESVSRLKSLGLGDADVEALLGRLRAENEKYVKLP